MTGSIHWPTAVLVAGTMLLLGLAVALLGRNRRRGFLSEVDRATYATLHTASLASQHLVELGHRSASSGVVAWSAAEPMVTP